MMELFSLGSREPLDVDFSPANHPAFPTGLSGMPVEDDGSAEKFFLFFKRDAR